MSNDLAKKGPNSCYRLKLHILIHVPAAWCNVIECLAMVVLCHHNYGPASSHLHEDTYTTCSSCVG